MIALIPRIGHQHQELFQYCADSFAVNKRLTLPIANLLPLSNSSNMSATHSHDAAHGHSHDGPSAVEHGHSHEILDGPGSYLGREMPIIEGRNWNDRAFTVGIGG